MSLAHYSEFEEFRRQIEELEEENRKLVETCEIQAATQTVLEKVIGSTNEKLLAAEMLSMELEQVFSSCADATWVVRQDGIVIRANPAMLRFLGLPEKEVVGRQCKDLLNADICSSQGCPLPKIKPGRKFFHEFDIERRNPDGKVEYFLVSTSSLVTLDGSPGIVAQIKDITLRKEAEAALGRLATIDGLTQVANRRSFDESLAQGWDRLVREQKPLSLILCDIDCFKKYNDHYGHQEGDECLRQVSRALKGCANRPADLVARYGGEEFVFLLPNTSLEGATSIAENARQKVEGLGLAHEKSLVKPVVTLSLGVASMTPSADNKPERLVQLADEALYRAKDGGRNRVVAG